MWKLGDVTETDGGNAPPSVFFECLDPVVVSDGRQPHGKGKVSGSDRAGGDK